MEAGCWLLKADVAEWPCATSSMWRGHMTVCTDCIVVYLGCYGG